MLHFIESLLRLFKPVEIRQIERGCDKWGCGHYRAPRGDREHKGIDFIYHPGEPVRAFRAGTVTKIGRCYANSPYYRYPQISDSGVDMRYFYVDPIVKVGDKVKKGQIIGYAQDIEMKYPGITPHIHYEVKSGSIYLNPRNYL